MNAAVTDTVIFEATGRMRGALESPWIHFLHCSCPRGVPGLLPPITWCAVSEALFGMLVITVTTQNHRADLPGLMAKSGYVSLPWFLFVLELQLIFPSILLTLLFGDII